MKLRMLIGRRAVVVDGVVDVVVMTAAGDAMAVCTESSDKAVVAAHALDKDFRTILSRSGVNAPVVTEVKV